jgi:hypothetical protein
MSEGVFVMLFIFPKRDFRLASNPRPWASEEPVNILADFISV